MRQAAERPRGYPSDLTDAQWQIIAPHLPAEVPRRRGRPWVWPLRRIVEAILYLDRAGCAWRYLPSDYPPWGTLEKSSEIWKSGCERCS
jgi:transposase